MLTRGRGSSEQVSTFSSLIIRRNDRCDEARSSWSPALQVGQLALGQMLFATPSLRARHLEKQLRWQQLLVPELSKRMEGAGGAHATLRASAVVAAALACLDAASQAWVACGGTVDLANLYDEAVEAVGDQAPSSHGR